MPAAVACGMLGRPSRAMLTTLEGAGTKSTVIAAPAPGTDSVADSPVSSHQRGQPRPRALAHVQLRQHPVGQPHELQPEPVGPAG